MQNSIYAEQPILMLRNVRVAFESKLIIPENTIREIRFCSPMLKKIPSDYVRDELSAMLLVANERNLRQMRELGFFKQLLPEMERCFGVPQRNKYHLYDVGTHILKATVEIEPKLELKWAAFMHDIGKPNCSSTDADGIIHFYGHHMESVAIADNILHRLRFEQDTIKRILNLIEYHDVRPDPSPTAIKNLMSRIGSDAFVDLLKLQRADAEAKNPMYIKKKVAAVDRVEEVYNKIVDSHQPFSLDDLVINARDLIKLKYRAGHEINRTLNILLGEVILNSELNNRTYLLNRAQELKKR